MFKKSVVVGIIILLFGVVIQPVTAFEIKKSIFKNEIVEDCGCEEVSNNEFYRVKLLLVKIKVVTNFILMKFGNIPEIKESCQEILTAINSIGILYNEGICMIVWILYNYLGLIAGVLIQLFDIFEYYNFQLIANMILTIMTPIANMLAIVLEIGEIFDCFDWMS